MRRPILEENKSYTFSDYFKLPYSTKEIVAEFGYNFRLTRLELPRKYLPEVNLDRLKTNFYKRLPHLFFTADNAKREVWVAPVLLELFEYVEVGLDIESFVKVNRRLTGNLDYVVVQDSRELIVKAAKNGDMEKGFTQLAVQLIARNKVLDTDGPPFLYGAVTMGEVWQFGLLNRQNKTISKNIGAFLVPRDLDDLFAVLLGILDGGAA